MFWGIVNVDIGFCYAYPIESCFYQGIHYYKPILFRITPNIYGSALAMRACTRAVMGLFPFFAPESRIKNKRNTRDASG